MSQTTLTVEKIKAFAANPENVELAQRYGELKVKAAQERAKMDALYRPIYEKFDFRDAITGEAITYDENALYASTQNEMVDRYFAEIDAARRAEGYDLPQGHCPALTAEHELIKHECKMLKKSGRLLGVDGPSLQGDERKEMLDQFVRWVALHQKEALGIEILEAIRDRIGQPQQEMSGNG